MKWFRRNRTDRRALPPGASGDLTEFVYLDETAVTSLVSSLLGPITETQTEATTRDLLAEMSGSSDVHVPAFYHGNVAAKTSGSFGASRSVQRRTNIQTAFSELDVALRSRYALIDSNSGVPSGAAPSAVLRRALEDRHAIRVSDLTRGVPFTADVELGLDESYALLSLVEAFNEFASEPELFGSAAIDAYRPAQAVGRVLRMMMAGLVPLECALPNLQVYTWEGEDYVMTREVAHGLGASQEQPPLRLVAICEEASFWKDIRRVAFEKGRYRVTARAAKPGLQSSWSPIKMSDVIRGYFPEVALELDGLPKVMANAMRSGASSSPRPPAASHKVLAYVHNLAATRDQSLDERVLIEVLAVIDEGSALDSPDEWRPTLARVTKIVEQAWGVKFDQDELLDARRVMLATDSRPTALPVGENTQKNVRYVEADVVAIHW